MNVIIVINISRIYQQKKDITNDQPSGHYTCRLFTGHPGKEVTEQGKRNNNHPHKKPNGNDGGNKAFIIQPVFNQQGERSKKKQSAYKCES